MKHILLTLILFIGFNSYAQLEFSPEESTKTVTVDLTNDATSVKIETDLFNNNSNDATLNWKIVKISGPQKWDAQICVNIESGGCFGWGISCNVIDSIGLDKSFLIGTDSSSIADLGIRPKGTPGCGTYEFRVWSVDDSTTILATATYHFEINVNGDCTTATEDFDKKSIKIYPNPTHDSFTISENEYVKEYQIFNIVGKQMEIASFQNGDVVNITNYPNGLYLIRMLDNDGDVLKTTRLVKR